MSHVALTTRRDSPRLPSTYAFQQYPGIELSFNAGSILSATASCAARASAQCSLALW